MYECTRMYTLAFSAFSVNSVVLKSNPEILSLVSKHLFGQLEGFVNNEDPEISRKWDVCLYSI